MKNSPTDIARAILDAHDTFPLTTERLLIRAVNKTRELDRMEEEEREEEEAAAAPDREKELVLDEEKFNLASRLVLKFIETRRKGDNLHDLVVSSLGAAEHILRGCVVED